MTASDGLSNVVLAIQSRQHNQTLSGQASAFCSIATDCAKVVDFRPLYPYLYLYILRLYPTTISYDYILRLYPTTNTA